MLKHLKSNPNILLILLLILWAILNGLSAINTELMGFEAYNWLNSSLSLSWGYHSNPPLYALLTKLGTAIFGNTELGVRCMTILCHTLTLYIFWLIIKTPKSNHQSAIRYFLIAFSIPILHSFSVLSTPNAPMLLGITITLWGLKKIKNTPNQNTTPQYFLTVIYLALGFAIIAYAKHIGLLYIAILLAANHKLFKDWRVYIAISIFLLLYLPHLIWLQANNWVSMKNILASNSESSNPLLNIVLYIIELLLLYNPVLIAIVTFSLLKKRTKATLLIQKHYTKFLVAAIGLFLIISLFQSIEMRWLLPIIFPIIYIVFTISERSKKSAMIISGTSILIGVILLFLQITLITLNNPLTEHFGLYGNQINLKRAQLTLQGAPKQKRNENTIGIKNAELLITDAKHNQASLFNFYTSIPAYAMPSIYKGGSQYSYLDMTQHFYGRRVAVEIGKTYRDKMNRQEMWNTYRSITLPVDGTIFYQIDEFYIPTKQVKIEPSSKFPKKVLTGQLLAISLELSNPYDFDIPLGEGKNGFQIIMHIDKKGEEIYWDIALPFSPQTLGNNATITIATNVEIPVIKTGDYRIGFTLQKPPYSSWYNSKEFKIMIINPNS